MENQFSTHNRFVAPSELDEMLWHRRFEERERHAAGWRRNLSFAAFAVVVALIAMIIAR